MVGYSKDQTCFSSRTTLSTWRHSYTNSKFPQLLKAASFGFSKWSLAAPLSVKARSIIVLIGSLKRHAAPASNGASKTVSRYRCTTPWESWYNLWVSSMPHLSPDACMGVRVSLPALYNCSDLRLHNSILVATKCTSQPPPLYSGRFWKVVECGGDAEDTNLGSPLRILHVTSHPADFADLGIRQHPICSRLSICELPADSYFPEGYERCIRSFRH